MTDPRDLVPITPAEIIRVMGPLSRNTLKHLGQHFLCDRNLRDALVRDAQIQDNELILEVGTGLGILTAGLLSTKAQIVSVEIDDIMFTLARDFLGAFSNLTLINGEALNKNSLSQKVIDALEDKIAKMSETPRLRLVANLPYNIATTVINAVMEWQGKTGAKFAGIFAMVQKEVAQRLSAETGTKDFGYMTVLCALHGEFLRGRLIKPGVFFPPPKVDSMIISAELTHELLRKTSDYVYTKKFLHYLFMHRRKGALKSVKLGTDKINAEIIADAFADLHIDGTLRPEQLYVEEIISLANKCLELNVEFP
ncbi:MAG: 16S rRNA (adenine(1518)-N(6)/adenine(1519)-N(6))-dimethyltransferase RsmA [Planctomycetes bacterium]|nr:16S rRNA (adenine(1518)-N(6)/adenine(1519)-N(6))-dimethyltransferase RsmA [Planctomycetota bacterium]